MEKGCWKKRQERAPPPRRISTAAIADLGVAAQTLGKKNREKRGKFVGCERQGNDEKRGEENAHGLSKRGVSVHGTRSSCERRAEGELPC